jgi:hypothetical protein
MVEWIEAHWMWLFFGLGVFIWLQLVYLSMQASVIGDDIQHLRRHLVGY